MTPWLAALDRRRHHRRRPTRRTWSTLIADSVVEVDACIGRIMDKVHALGLDKNTLVFFTTDNGAWQDVYPDAGYTPFRGTKGTVREGGTRVPCITWMPARSRPG